MKPPKDSSADQQFGQPESTGKRSIAEHFQAGGATTHMPAGSQGSEQSHTKRQRTIESTIAGRPQGSMAEITGLMPPSDVDFRRTANFQPHTGVRKLVVKNLRQNRAVDLSEHYRKVQAQVLEDVVAILSDQQLHQPLERLYRHVEDICRNNQAEMLYKELRQRCRDYLAHSLLEDMQRIDNREDPLAFLEIFLSAWKDWNSKTVWDDPRLGF
jgi:hypothetical protein